MAFDPIKIPTSQLNNLLDGDLTNGEIRGLSKALGVPFQRIETFLAGGQMSDDIDAADMMWALGKIVLGRQGEHDPTDENADRVMFVDDDEGGSAEADRFPDS